MVENSLDKYGKFGLKKKRVLITGGAGFIGHHLCEEILKNTQWDIVVLDRLNYASSGFDRLKEIGACVNPRVTVLTTDLSHEIAEGIRKEIGEVNYIYHLAAETHVQNSIEKPEPFIRSNILGTFWLLEFAKSLTNLEKFFYFSTDEVFGDAPEGVAYKENDRYNSRNPYAASKAAGEELASAYCNTYGLPVVITHCYDEKTLALTEHGPKHYSELKEGDKVWVLKDNKQLILEPIQKVIKYYYNGTMVSMESTKASLLVTDKHRMLYKERFSNKDYEYGLAKDFLKIGKKRFYIPKTGEWKCNGTKSDKITVNIDLGYHFNKKVTPNTFFTRDYMEFMGWYISEGHARESGEVRFYNSNKKDLNDYLNLTKKMGFNPIMKEVKPSNISKKRTYTISIHSINLTKHLRMCYGGCSKEKRIDKSLLKLDKKYLKILFDTLIKGDGQRTKSMLRYYTSSKSLVNDMIELGLKVGYGINSQSRLCKHPYKNKLNEHYYVSFTKPTCGFEKHNIKEVKNFYGDVWCLQVPSKNFLVMRNGKVCVSGNCMNVFGERQHPEKYVSLCIRKIIHGETIKVHINPNTNKPGSRFWIHARNVAASIIFLTEKGKIGEKYNIVPKTELDNLEVAKLVAKSLGKELKYELEDFHSKRPGHDPRYALDGTKMDKMGWKIPVSFEDSFKKTMEWCIKDENKSWLNM